MAPSKPRVLLAGNSSYDMAAAQQYLRSEGCTVTTCSSGSKVAALLAPGHRFDLILAEGDEQGSHLDDGVNGMALLAAGRSPVAVVLGNFCDEAVVAAALKSGAVDVIRRPLSEQTDRLGKLLERLADGTLRTSVEAYVWPYVRVALVAAQPGCSSECGGALASSSGASTGTAAGGTLRCARADLRQDSVTQCSGDSGGPGQASSCLQELPFTPASGLPNELSHPFSADETPLLPSGSCLSVDFAGVETSLTSAGTRTKRDLESSCITSESSGAHSDAYGDNAGLKKQKVEWTSELHTCFDTVQQSGPQRPVPAQALGCMGPAAAAAGHTCQNDASCLQKQRQQQRQDWVGSPVLGVPCWPTHPMPPVYWQWQQAPAMVPAMVPTSATQLQRPARNNEGIPPEAAVAINDVLRQHAKGEAMAPSIGLQLDIAAVLRSAAL